MATPNEPVGRSCLARDVCLLTHSERRVAHVRSIFRSVQRSNLLPVCSPCSRVGVYVAVCRLSSHLRSTVNFVWAVCLWGSPRHFFRRWAPPLAAPPLAVGGFSHFRQRVLIILATFFSWQPRRRRARAGSAALAGDRASAGPRELALRDRSLRGPGTLHPASSAALQWVA